jgi:hypothetical protein
VTIQLETRTLTRRAAAPRCRRVGVAIPDWNLPHPVARVAAILDWNMPDALTRITAILDWNMPDPVPGPRR